MAVKAGERNQGDLTVITKAKDHAAYTLAITDNEKNFPKRHRFSTANKLQEKAFTILECLIEANEFYPKTPEELNHRRFLQRKAIAGCKSMLTMIDVCKQRFAIKTTTVEYWTRQLWDIRNLTAAWLVKDEARFKSLLR